MLFWKKTSINDCYTIKILQLIKWKEGNYWTKYVQVLKVLENNSKGNWRELWMFIAITANNNFVLIFK